MKAAELADIMRHGMQVVVTLPDGSRHPGVSTHIIVLENGVFKLLVETTIFPESRTVPGMETKRAL